MFYGRNKAKIFCISMQRTGTTSVGKFFKAHGFTSAGWRETKKNNWGQQYFVGDYESIFKSNDFKLNQVFEDGPWSVEHFYKYLFHKFPDAKFVLFTRDSDKWFDSMMKHSNGKTVGNTFRHCCFYQRESEYYNFIQGNHDFMSNEIDNLLELNESHRQHYTSIFNNRNRQVLDFFKSFDPENKRFIHLELEQKDKWIKLGQFFNFEVPTDFEIHVNKSKM